MLRNETGDWVWSSDEDDDDEDPAAKKKTSKSPKQVLFRQFTRFNHIFIIIYQRRKLLNLLNRFYLDNFTRFNQ